MADPPIPPKKTKGQQKIELKLIEDPKKRSVTFSKRKGGLFRKAEELYNLTGAEVAIMIISPGGKAFTNENPDSYRVINRYKDQATPSPRIEQQKAELRELLKQLKIEDKRTKALRNNRNHMRTQTFMAAPSFTYTRAQTEEMKQRLLLLNNVLSHPPPGFFNSYSIFPPQPPPDSTLEILSSSFPAMLTHNPEIQGSFGFSCGPLIMEPVIGNQNFGGNIVLTPSGNFCRSDSSLVAQAGTYQNHMSQNNMWPNSHGNFQTGTPSSMLPVAAQNQMSHQDMFATPHDSMMLPVATQNHTPSNPYYKRDASSLVAPVGTHQNSMFTDIMWPNSHGNLYTGESSSMFPVATQYQMSHQDNMFATPHDSTILPMATQNQMSQNNMIVTHHDSMMLPVATQNQMSQDNMINIVTPHDSMMLPVATQNQMSQDNMMVTPSDNMMLADNYDDLFIKSGLFLTSEEPTQLNQIVDENMMIPPHKNFYTFASSSAVVPPPPAPVDDDNQIFDENIIASPPHNAYESSLVPPADDESKFFEERLMMFLYGDDKLNGNSSSMGLPEESHRFNGNVIPPPQPSPCVGYGGGGAATGEPLGFN